MARYGRPKTVPDPVSDANPLRCRRNWENEETGRLEVCNQPVPPGELTHLSLNNQSGPYLALCAEHRTELEQWYDDWASAAVGQGRLYVQYLELPDGELIKESALRDVLKEHKEPGLPRSGGLTKDLKLRALELLRGSKVREEMESRLFPYVGN